MSPNLTLRDSETIAVATFFTHLQEILNAHGGGKRFHLIDKQVSPGGWVITFKDDVYPDQVFSKTFSGLNYISGDMRSTDAQEFAVSIIDHDGKENERALVRARWKMIHDASQSAEGKILVCILEKLEEISTKLK